MAFPWFCWFPIVFASVSYALYEHLSWGIMPILGFWAMIFAICSFLWIRGQKLEEKASNPLKGILPSYYNPNAG